ncbi:MAG: hypothetical protein ACPL1Y_04200 [Thermoplasmata archaeon]
MRVLIKEIRCRSCGTVVDPMCKFCPVCGTNLEEAFVITIGDILKNIQDDIEAKMREIEEREEALAVRESALEKKERDYRERLERLYLKEHELEEYETRLKEKEIEIAKKYDEIIQKEKELNEKEHKLLLKEKDIIRMLEDIGKYALDKDTYPEIAMKLKMMDELLEEHEKELRKIEEERLQITRLEEELQRMHTESRGTIECPLCGSINPDTNKRCRICGAGIGT